MSRSLKALHSSDVGILLSPVKLYNLPSFLFRVHSLIVWVGGSGVFFFCITGVDWRFSKLSSKMAESPSIVFWCARSGVNMCVCCVITG